MKTSDIKKKVAEKVGKGKGKVAKKCGGAKKACAIVVVAFLATTILCGCSTAEAPTAQRSQNSTQEDNVYNIYSYIGGGGVSSNTIPADVWSRIPDSALADVIAAMFRPAVNVEIGNQAQANETSGTETMTATNDQKPTNTTEVPVDVRYNDVIAGASAASRGVLETLSGKGLESVLSLMKSKASGTVEVEREDGSSATVECRDGQCQIR